MREPRFLIYFWRREIAASIRVLLAEVARFRQKEGSEPKAFVYCHVS
jgi:hypothetical protein